MQFVHRANMISMGVRQYNALDGLTQRLCRLYDILRSAFYCGVDQRETVILTHKVTIHHAQKCQFDKIVSMLADFHR
jgi:hypothetical protein